MYGFGGPGTGLLRNCRDGNNLDCRGRGLGAVGVSSRVRWCIRVKNPVMDWKVHLMASDASRMLIATMGLARAIQSSIQSG
jgi:hypothetical protein